MRSPAEALRILMLALALGAVAPASHALTPDDEVRKAAAEVQRDPDLGGKRKTKVLRLRPGDEQAPKPDSDMPGWIKWLRNLGQWLAETGRLLVWLAGASAVAALIVSARRWTRQRGDALPPKALAVPSHVQGLDIRTSSLPDAVGASAANLWQLGEHRAALSLLYRGALSHLVHRHSVPVRGSSTEAECVLLARGHIDARRGEFFARLVQVWLLAVYGTRLPEGETVIEVCHAFDQLWPPQNTGAAA